MPPKKNAKTAKKTAASAKKAHTAAAKTKKAIGSEKKELIVCVHCEGTGKCAAGVPYDKEHHQAIFREERLTSCGDCLEAAGKSRKAKKMVTCRFCKGTGKVEKPE